MRHGTTALLPLGKRLLSLKHFCPLQMAKLNRPTFEACSNQGDGTQKFRVVIPLHHLGGNGCRLETQLFAHKIFHPWREVRIGANRPRKFSHRRNFPRPLKTFQSATKFVIH